MSDKTPKDQPPVNFRKASLLARPITKPPDPSPPPKPATPPPPPEPKQ